MKIKLFFTLFIFTSAFLFAQYNVKPTYYVTNVMGTGNAPGDNTFLANLMEMEIRIRDYTVTENPREADYTLTGIIRPFPGPQRFVFFMAVRDTKTGVDILEQNVVYNYVEEVIESFPLLMYNLFANIPGIALTIAEALPDPVFLNPLISEPEAPPDTEDLPDDEAIPEDPPIPEIEPIEPRLAVQTVFLNPSSQPITIPEGQVVYITTKAESEPDDAWRNKHLYFTACGLWSPRLYTGDSDSVHISNFGFLLTAEWNFWRFLSLGAGVEFSGDWIVTNDASYRDIILEVPVTLRGVFRPFNYFLIEPYLGAHLNVTLTRATYPSLISWLAGFQYGVKTGPGLIVVDIRFSTDLFPSYVADQLEYRRTILRLGIGYKIGLFDKKRK